MHVLNFISHHLLTCFSRFTINTLTICTQKEYKAQNTKPFDCWIAWSPQLCGIMVSAVANFALFLGICDKAECMRTRGESESSMRAQNSLLAFDERIIYAVRPCMRAFLSERSEKRPPRGLSTLLHRRCAAHISTCDERAIDANPIGTGPVSRRRGAHALLAWHCWQLAGWIRERRDYRVLLVRIEMQLPGL